MVRRALRHDGRFCLLSRPGPVSRRHRTQETGETGLLVRQRGVRMSEIDVRQAPLGGSHRQVVRFGAAVLRVVGVSVSTLVDAQLIAPNDGAS